MTDADFEPEAPMPSKRPAKEPKPRAAAPEPQEAAPDVPIIQTAELAQIVENEPGAVLLDEKKRGQLYAEIEKAVSAHKPDLSTGVGRKAIASLAYKIVRTKTAIDAAGKELNAEFRAKIDAVDEVRRDVRAKLDGIADTARAPLTKWEEAEKAREDAKRAILAQIADAIIARQGDTSEDIAARLEAVKAVAIDPAIFLDDADDANTRRDEAVSALAYALNAAQEREKQAAELERLRAAEAEREAELARLREAEAQRQREEDQRRIDQERAEREAREAAENAEREKTAAIERARAEERERAEAEREAAALAHRQELERIEQEARAKAEAEAAERAAQQSRDADAAHRRAVNTAARDALIEAGGIEKDAANKIVTAIIGGSVPHVTLAY